MLLDLVLKGSCDLLDMEFWGGEQMRFAEPCFWWVGIRWRNFWKVGCGWIGTLFWVGESGWENILGGCEWLGVYEALLWVGRGCWQNILGGWLWELVSGALFLVGWRWVGKVFGWVVVGGAEYEWVHCLIMPNF